MVNEFSFKIPSLDFFARAHATLLLEGNRSWRTHRERELGNTEELTAEAQSRQFTNFFHPAWVVPLSPATLRSSCLLLEEMGLVPLIFVPTPSPLPTAVPSTGFAGAWVDLVHNE